MVNEETYDCDALVVGSGYAGAVMRGFAAMAMTAAAAMFALS
ncbi:hypothetical protein [Bradyrhizobium sp. CCBAU 51753]|nr:hypothetical protein [Bradyrhizobium sp. CCBAU 51753]